MLVAQAVVSIALLRAWVNAGTHHLYLADRADVGSASAAGQRFVVEGARVVPQILTHDRDGFRFALPHVPRGMLRFGARPAGRASIEVRWTDGAHEQTLGRRELTGPAEIALRLPARGGVLDMASQGTVVWSDLRVEETFPWWPHAAMLGLLVLLGWMLPRADARFTIEWTPRQRFLLVRAGAFGRGGRDRPGRARIRAARGGMGQPVADGRRTEPSG